MPPDLPSSTSPYFVWGKGSVLRWVPLSGDLGMESGERVGIRDPLVCTVRTASTSKRALPDSRLPFMGRVLRALPPSLFCRLELYLVGGEVILRRVQFFSDLGTENVEAVSDREL